MDSQTVDFDAPPAVGTQLDRLRAALRAAADQSRVAQQAACHGRHVEDALVAVEEAIATQLVNLAHAVMDDADEAGQPGEAERLRQSWFQRYRAA
jgi:hypothetical protein